jgi:hypothetical protein
MRRRNLLFFGIIAFIAIVIWSAAKDSGMNSLTLDFKEVAFIQNENNTGPVKRRYIVAVSDTIWSELEIYGNLMPYSKLGSTEVFFFLNGQELPKEVQLSNPPFDKDFDTTLVAHYMKNNMGQVSLKK